MRRLLLVLALLLGACSSEQASRTWQSEIDLCARTTGNLEACYSTAGFAIHAQCQLDAYQPMAAMLIARVTDPISALNIMVAEGLCQDELLVLLTQGPQGPQPTP